MTTKPRTRATLLLHSCTIPVRLGDTDAAGRWYFATWLQRAHEIFEDWLDTTGLPLRRLMTMPFALPVVHAEADFHLSVRLGDQLHCALLLCELGEKSFTLEATARRDSSLVATCRITHVAVDKSSGSSMPLPEMLLAKLQVGSS